MSIRFTHPMKHRTKVHLVQKGFLLGLLGISSLALSRAYPITECGSDLTGKTPDFTAIASQQVGEGLATPEFCGTKHPTLNLRGHDPFAAKRYQAPNDNLIPPFQACRDAYQEMMNRRPNCDTIDHNTMLVSKLGQSDPRWNPGRYTQVFETIQGAIDSAAHCDHIVVRPGIYQEYLKIAGKDVKVYSDTWNAAGTQEDGNEKDLSYVAEKIDLTHYYQTGERVVVDRHPTYRKPLKRAVRTVIQGGGFAEGPTLGGMIADEHNVFGPNGGCGNRRPMIDFIAGTTRHTVVDGFAVRLMPEQDHMVPGHGHALQMRGSSPIVKNNLMYNNGSTSIGVHANFINTTPFTPTCEARPELEQATYKNSDFTTANIQYRPLPLVYDNISYQNNGLAMGNNHYSCAVMMNNEAFWNAVPGEEATHNSPGIGSRHGAKTCIDLNIVYENAWTGIGAHQGVLQPATECAQNPLTCKSINERTRTIISRNIVFDNGHPNAPAGFVGGIGADGVGTPDEPAIITENISFNSLLTGIGVRNDLSGSAAGLLDDETYVKVTNNVAFSNATLGVACRADKGKTNCLMEGNEVFWNKMAGLGFRGNVEGAILNNTAACNTFAGVQNLMVTGNVNTPMYNNIAFANGTAGVMALGSNHGFNLMAANNGHPLDCSQLGFPFSRICQFQQVGRAMGGAVGDGDMFADPMFVDPLNFNYKLKIDSPAIDAGRDVSVFNTTRNHLGDQIDIGSREQ